MNWTGVARRLGHFHRAMSTEVTETRGLPGNCAEYQKENRKIIQFSESWFIRSLWSS